MKASTFQRYTRTDPCIFGESPRKIEAMACARKSPGKFVSHIHDVLVTPLFDPDAPPSTAILEGELARAIEFGSHALNPGAITDLQRLAIQHGIEWSRFGGIGVEDDENESSGTHHDETRAA